MGRGFDTFMKNPYWKKIYEDAPSNKLREYYKIRYDASGFINGEAIDVNGQLEGILLSKEEIQYIQKHAGSGQARHFYQKFIDRLSGEYEGYCFPAAAFQVEEWNPWYRPEEEK